ncbi:MAG: SGNH/GDSL hydrolase family protein [Clostridia bacterium]|nr:SGNH/GDSL hydrolase family protein [Clostridia bacterium]
MENFDTYFRLNDKDEKPLEKLLEGGGFSAIFRSIGCIGDSLSSGELEAVQADGKTAYYDFFEYSWGQFIARTNGALVHNFSRGGMTAQEYCDSFAESKGFWNPELAAQAYIIALGVNDVTRAAAQRKDPDEAVYLGNPETDVDVNDWHNNAKTFVGYYAQIIQRMREISPKCRIFLMSCPRQTTIPDWRKDAYDLHRDLLYKLADMFEYVYVLDLRTYAPEYDEEFHKHFFLSGHLNTMGYLLTARLVMTYIDYIVRHNTEDFLQAGFIGKGGVHNVKYKW